MDDILIEKRAHSSIEHQLFSNWSSWDVGEDYGDTILYDAVLKVSIGRFNIGDKFSSAYISTNKSYVKLYLNATDELPIAKFRLYLTIGEEL